MEGINNLDELKDLVGSDTVDKCFAEYMITQEKRLSNLINHCVIMDEDKMNSYINSIGREELYQEIEDVYSDKYRLIRPNQSRPYPRYLKAIRVSLVTQGYDEQWVDTVFRDALEAKYLKK